MIAKGLILIILAVAQQLLISDAYMVRGTIGQRLFSQLRSSRMQLKAASDDDDLLITFMKHVSKQLVVKANANEPIPVESVLELKEAIDFALLSTMMHSEAEAAAPIRGPASPAPAPTPTVNSNLPPLTSKSRSKSPSPAMEYALDTASAELAPVPTPTPVPAPKTVTPVTSESLTDSASKPFPKTGPSARAAQAGSYMRKLEEERARKAGKLPPKQREAARVGTTVAGLVNTDPNVFPDGPDEDTTFDYGLGSSWDVPGQENMTSEEYYKAINDRNKEIRRRLQAKYKTKEPAKEYFDAINKKNRNAPK